MCSTASHRAMAAARGDLGVEEGERGHAVGRQRGAGVEAEPPEPEQAGAEHHQRQVVWAHRFGSEAEPWSEYQGQREPGGTGVDVDDGAAGEVDDPQVRGDPAVRAEDPVRDRGVDERHQAATKITQVAELGAVGDGPAEQGRGDDREHQLEGREDEDGYGTRGATGRDRRSCPRTGGCRSVPAPHPDRTPGSIRTTTQTSVTTAIAMKTIMSMLRVLLTRTMPP